MEIRLGKASDGFAIDLGNHGYIRSMYVVRNVALTREILEKASATRAYAEFAQTNRLHLVCFASSPDGTGAFVEVPMRAADAESYPVGATANLYFRKDGTQGFGRLVAVMVDDAPMPSFARH